MQRGRGLTSGFRDKWTLFEEFSQNVHVRLGSYVNVDPLSGLHHVGMAVKGLVH